MSSTTPSSPRTVRAVLSSLSPRFSYHTRRSPALIRNMFRRRNTTSMMSDDIDRKRQEATIECDRKTMHGTIMVNDTDEMILDSKQKSDETIPGNIIDWHLTRSQRDLLIRTWSDDFDFLYDLGTHIYVFLFDHEPNMKRLFPAVHAHGDDWKESKEFRSQALKFVQTLSLSIKNIYHIDRLEPIIYDIGKAHCRYAARGFKPHYWDVFQSAMESSLSEHIATSSALSNDVERKMAIGAWRHLADFIVANMKRGFGDGMRVMKEHEQTNEP